MLPAAVFCGKYLAGAGSTGPGGGQWGMSELMQETHGPGLPVTQAGSFGIGLTGQGGAW